MEQFLQTKNIQTKKEESSENRHKHRGLEMQFFGVHKNHYYFYRATVVYYGAQPHIECIKLKLIKFIFCSANGKISNT